MDVLGLKGKRALVVGGGYSMGRATARLLAGQGAELAVVDIVPERPVALADELRGSTKVVPITADVTDRGQAQAAVARAADELGGLDILVNVVGRNWSKPLLDVESDLIEQIFSVNLRHHLYVETAFARLPHPRGQGRSITSISSISGMTANPGAAPYGAAKAALISLTQTMAVEWAPRDIRVNTVAPGMITTDRNPRGPDIKERSRRMVPMRRVGDQMEVAKVVLFLTSDLASYVTGQVVVVDGGLSVLTAFMNPDNG